MELPRQTGQLLQLIFYTLLSSSLHSGLTDSNSCGTFFSAVLKSGSKPFAFASAFIKLSPFTDISSFMLLSTLGPGQYVPAHRRLCELKPYSLMLSVSVDEASGSKCR